MVENIHPKVFISYSWSSFEHEQWVIKFATELRDCGVNVILDKWDLKEGNDSNVFMEKMVTDSEIEKVILICDRIYAEKADKRKGGVGTETQIISSEVYSKVDQSKFVAVVVEKDENNKAYLPTYYKSRIYIDLSNYDSYSSNFEQLLRWIYNKPLYVKPEIGKKPEFLSDDSSLNLGTEIHFRRAIDFIRNHKEYAQGAISEFFNTSISNLERFRIKKDDSEFDDLVVKNIEEFLPYRNQAIELFIAICQYYDNNNVKHQLHRFFENLIPYLSKPKNISQYQDWDFDNYRFIVHELFLYVVTILIKYEKFDVVAYLFRHHYYFEEFDSTNNLKSFTCLKKHLSSLEYRNQRLKLRRLSIRADLLSKRSTFPGLSFNHLMQSDFVIFLRNSIDSIRANIRQSWIPETLIYSERFFRSFEIFARAQSEEYFKQLIILFDIDGKNDLDVLLQTFSNGRLMIPSWEASTFSPEALMGYQNLCTTP